MHALDWARRAQTVAGRQHGLVTRRQLLALGASREAVQVARETGRLVDHPHHRGVYGLGALPRTAAARFLGAVLSCGDGTVLSHVSAAINFNLLADRPRAPVDVSSPRWRSVTPQRRVHELRQPLDPRDRCHRNGIPTTTVPRLILDLAETATTRELEHALNEAHFALGLTLDAVKHAALRAPGRHALRPITQLLARYDDGTTWTRTAVERALAGIIATTGLPTPAMNHPFGAFEIDAAWPQHRLAIEVDGRAAHSAPVNFERDRVKQNALVLAGWLVLRFTPNQVTDHADRVAREIAAAYARAATGSAAPGARSPRAPGPAAGR
jgi:very-short-patch-repair endonuclease